MALPSGVLVAVVNIGQWMDDLGEPHSGRVSFEARAVRVWAATGDALLSGPEVVTLVEGSGTIRLPATDQPGFVATDGQPLVNWTYRVTVSIDGRSTRRFDIALPTHGADEVPFDLDMMIPVEGSTGLPPSMPYVISVNGMSGVVTVEVPDQAQVEEWVDDYLATNPPTVSDASVAALVDNDTSATAVAVDARIVDGTVVLSNRVSAIEAWDLGNLGDVEVAGATAGQVLTLEAGVWVARAPASAPVTSVQGRTGAVVVTAADVGLGNVDDTSDADKPMSTATVEALEAKADVTALTAVSAQVDAAQADIVSLSSDLTGLEGIAVTSADVDDVVRITQAAYDALGSGRPARRLYLVTA